MSEINLSSAVRTSLSSLQSTADLLSKTQERLATGNKVNSALDDPSAFFTAAALSDRANDLSTLLDDQQQSIQVVEAADEGISAISDLVESARAIANQALQTDNADERASFAQQFDDILGQIETLAGDASFNGINLLDSENSQDLTVVFNEKNTASLTVEGVNFTDAGAALGLNRVSSINNSAGTGAAVASATTFDDSTLAAGTQASFTVGNSNGTTSTFTVDFEGSAATPASDSTANASLSSFNTGDQLTIEGADGTQAITLSALDGADGAGSVSVGTADLSGLTTGDTVSISLPGVGGGTTFDVTAANSSVSDLATALNSEATSEGIAGFNATVNATTGALEISQDGSEVSFTFQNTDGITGAANGATVASSGDPAQAGQTTVTNAQIDALNVGDEISFTENGATTTFTLNAEQIATLDNATGGNAVNVGNAFSSILQAEGFTGEVETAANGDVTFSSDTGNVELDLETSSTTGTSDGLFDASAPTPGQNDISAANIGALADGDTLVVTTTDENNQSVSFEVSLTAGDITDDTALASAISTAATAFAADTNNSTAARAAAAALTVTDNSGGGSDEVNLSSTEGNVTLRVQGAGAPTADLGSRVAFNGTTTSNITDGTGSNQIDFSSLEVGDRVNVTFTDGTAGLGTAPSEIELVVDQDLVDAIGGSGTDGAAEFAAAINNAGTPAGFSAANTGSTVNLASSAGFGFSVSVAETSDANVFNTTSTNLNDGLTLDDVASQINAETANTGVGAAVDTVSNQLVLTSSTGDFTIDSNAVGVDDVTGTGFAEADAGGVLTADAIIEQVNAAATAAGVDTTSGAFNISVQSVDGTGSTPVTTFSLSSDTGNVSASSGGATLANSADTSVNTNTAFTSGNGGGSNFSDTDAINQTLQAIDEALGTLRSTATSLGSDLSTIQIRSDFTSNLINTLEVGAGNLTLADLNEEGANLLTLQTRQQLSSTSLSFATQQDQSVLSLF